MGPALMSLGAQISREEPNVLPGAIAVVGTGPGAAPEAPGQSIGTKDRAAMPCLWFWGLLPLLYPQLCLSGCHCQVLQGALPFTQKLGKQTWGGDLRHVAAFLLGTGGGDIASHLDPSSIDPCPAHSRAGKHQGAAGVVPSLQNPAQIPSDELCPS